MHAKGRRAVVAAAAAELFRTGDVQQEHAGCMTRIAWLHRSEQCGVLGAFIYV